MNFHRNLAVVLVTFLLATNLPISFSRVSYAKDPREAKKLALVEINFVSTLSSVGQLEQFSPDCSNSLSVYLEKYKEASSFLNSHDVEGKAQEISNNGLLIYKLIHRLVKLFHFISQMCKLEVQTRVNQVFVKANISQPGDTDLNDALLGMLRNQFVYGFNASDLHLGKFNEAETGVKLDFEECFSLAHKAIFLEANVLAYQWLLAASEKDTTQEGKRQLIVAWNTLAWQENVNCTDHLNLKVKDILQLEMPALSPYHRYSSCRGEYGQTELSRSQHKLYCYYHKSGSWYYAVNPVKVEMLSKEPLILEYHDFVKDETIEFLKNSGYDNTSRDIFESRSLKFKKDEADYMSEYGEYSTSVDFEMKEEVYDEEPPDLLKYLDKRMGLVTGLDVDIVDSQMLMYSALGGHYDIHHDATIGTSQYMDQWGERIANFYISLAGMEMGGYLAFPVIGVYAKPKKGNAILWFNSLRNGYPDIRNYHTGCPVILGTKQIIRWGIYQHPNIWNHPCLLDPSK